MADNQDPLAALQQLLSDQKNQAGSDGSVVPSNDQTSGVAGEVPPIAVVEEEKGPSAEEIAELQKAKAAEDQIKIEEQLAKMQTELKDTPQYQARLSQKEANDADSEAKRLEERSRRIFQLKHLDS
ncbi:MAG: hypothetical protein UT13_C0001G0787 [Candidatus Pacebacteria bacterium GW2011_GWF2_38_9]|nr:MAG: hypothetical protein US01_C0001G0823 [candidate division TM6 bacterium GW2011_GWF2_28_16]KKQ08079.1 MAG: hypothetical protein US20_C0024G0003 [Candidatus Pacebacteria bacterium GW2011_GWF1_36_5]KKQ89139.1 MAG: hypothetical protein UT13_C0001G0787 [Candidatus Pacebacteria bacterium GW2011_GWF2_38_9]